MGKRFHWIAFVSALLTPAVVRAQVSIPLDCRIRNLPRQRAGWCALETLARYHHLTELYHLADEHTSAAQPADLEEALDKVNVNYRVQDTGCRNKAILRYAVREKLGAVVSFREYKKGAGRHMLTLVDYGPTEVRVIDSNDSDGLIRTMSLKRFLSWWDGFALVIEPEEAQLETGKERSSSR